MDLRIKRTRKCIIDAFMEIRAKKDLEKISVKELSDRAMINKATFYNHFDSVFDLSDKLEDEVIGKVLLNIEPAEWGTGEGARHIAMEMHKMKEPIAVLFSGSRYGFLVQKLEKGIKEKVYACFPHYKENPTKDIMLTIMIYGGFYATNKYEGEDLERALDVVANMNDCFIEEMLKKADRD